MLKLLREYLPSARDAMLVLVCAMFILANLIGILRDQVRQRALRKGKRPK